MEIQKGVKGWGEGVSRGCGVLHLALVLLHLPQRQVIRIQKRFRTAKHLRYELLDVRSVLVAALPGASDVEEHPIGTVKPTPLEIDEHGGERFLSEHVVNHHTRWKRRRGGGGEGRGGGGGEEEEEEERRRRRRRRRRRGGEEVVVRLGYRRVE